jgi:excisionase family DNA binding protein
MSTQTQTATPEDANAFLSPAEVARLAAISRKTVYRENDRGELPAIHVGRQLRIDPTDLGRYLGADAVTRPAPTPRTRRARGGAAAAARTWLDFGFVVDISSPAGRRVTCARSRAGLEVLRRGWG